tara:strand:- start:270 stop:401 length:132 start_codon:yes stop_codon:yes gene_type:complete
MNLIYTKKGLMDMEIEELEKHKEDAWNYYTKTKKVFNFREIEE